MNLPTLSRIGLGSAVTLAMITAGTIRAALPVLAPEIRSQFGIGRADFGLILTCFLVAIALGAPVAGRVADATGGRRILLARFVVAALGMVLVSQARGPWWLGAAMAITGIGMSAGNPGTNRLIADHVPAGERGTVLGVKQSGGQAGVLLAGLVLPAAAGVWSWRVAVATIVILPLVGFALLMGTVPRDPEQRSVRSVRRLDRQARNRLVRFLLVGALMGAATQSVFGFLPLFATERLGFTLAEAGLVTVVVATTSTVFRVIWARWSDRVTNVATPAIILAFLAAAAAALTGSAEILHPWALWLGAVALGATAESWNAVANVTVVRISGGQTTGQASGLMMFVTLLAGAAGPLIFGALADLTGSYGPSWVAAAATYVVAAAAALRWHRVTSGSDL